MKRIRHISIFSLFVYNCLLGSSNADVYQNRFSLTAEEVVSAKVMETNWRNHINSQKSNDEWKVLPDSAQNTLLELYSALTINSPRATAKVDKLSAECVAYLDDTEAQKIAFEKALGAASVTVYVKYLILIGDLYPDQIVTLLINQSELKESSSIDFILTGVAWELLLENSQTDGKANFEDLTKMRLLASAKNPAYRYFYLEFIQRVLISGEPLYNELVLFKDEVDSTILTMLINALKEVNTQDAKTTLEYIATQATSRTDVGIETLAQNAADSIVSE